MCLEFVKSNARDNPCFVCIPFDQVINVSSEAGVQRGLSPPEVPIVYQKRLVAFLYTICSHVLVFLSISLMKRCYIVDMLYVECSMYTWPCYLWLHFAFLLHVSFVECCLLLHVDNVTCENPKDKHD